MIDNFNVFLPINLIEKGSKDNPQYVIRGYASTPDKDVEDEEIVQEGMDITPFVKYGWFNFDHDKKDIVGFPTNAKITDKGLYVEGELLPNKRGEWVKDTYFALKKTNTKNRKLGFSVEGKILERDRQNPKKITKAVITDIAITPKPVNQNAGFELEMISKALAAGYQYPAMDSGDALRVQELEGGLSTQTYTMPPIPYNEESNESNGGKTQNMSDEECVGFLVMIGFDGDAAKQILEYAKASKGVYYGRNTN